MSIINSIAALMGPATKLIDELHTSTEETMQIKLEQLKIHYSFMEKVMEHEQKLLQYKTEVIKAEASNSNWITSMWRPITMLVFTAIVVLDSFGVLPNSLSDEVFTLLTLGIGGYTIGRSAEKIANTVTKSKIGVE